MSRTRLAMCVLALTFIVAGCGTGQDTGGADTGAKRKERVFDPLVGALYRAYGVEHVADDHNRALDDALRDNEVGKEERR